MATAKLSLDEGTVESKIQLPATIHTAMTGNPLFPTPNPALDSLL